jgi:antitoxin MazE
VPTPSSHPQPHAPRRHRLGFQQSNIASYLGFTDGAEVEVAVEIGRLVAYPLGRRRYTLEEMLEGITDENVHPEVDFGPPVGKEIL